MILTNKSPFSPQFPLIPKKILNFCLPFWITLSRVTMASRTKPPTIS